MISARERNKIVCILFIELFLAMNIFSCAKNSQTMVSMTGAAGAPALPYPRVHFPFDSDEILAADTALMDENADWLKRHQGAVIILEGHCDEIGPSEYNMELGDRRARSVKAYLVAKGVAHDRVIMVVSYGDTRPLDPAHSREAWRMNRRVEFILR